jgi:ATP-binding cassette subfamily B protein RaxB
MLQSEEAECGLACVAMIANPSRPQGQPAGLRQRFPVSLKGATLADLMGVASNLELAPRALRLELDEIDKLQRPRSCTGTSTTSSCWRKVGKGGRHDRRSGRRAADADDARDRPPLHRRRAGADADAISCPVEARTKTRLRDLWSRLTIIAARRQVLACRCCCS